MRSSARCTWAIEEITIAEKIEHRLLFSNPFITY